tara:strand:- start:2948 stop:3850 length:903 start_codon:yes stop_codon:yes gene_type:complete
MKKILYILLLFIFTNVIAQQQPQYSQYMYNMNVVNPAYVINEPGIIYVGALYRQQWNGIEGGPKTANLFANIPTNDHIEFSFNYINDQIGEVQNENIFNVDFAYILPIARRTKMAFGVKAGISNLALDFSQSNVSSDPSFQNQNSTFFNAGAGLFVFNEKFYVGFSAPNLFPADLNEDNQNVYEQKTHFYGMAGYVFDVNPNLKLKPSTMIKQSIGAPLTFDASLNARFYDKFEIGTSYRFQENMAFMAAVNVSYNFRIGYAYDYNASKLRDFDNGSHEIILLYNFGLIKSKKYISPRFY